MSKKKIKILLSILSSLIILMFFILMLRTRIKGTSQIIIENNTCCFMATNIEVIAITENKDNNKLINFGNLPSEGNKKTKRLYLKNKEQVSVNLEFEYSYGNEGHTKIPITFSENFQTSKGQKIVIKFNEYETIYLTVLINGNERVYIYNMNKDQWILKSI